MRTRLIAGLCGVAIAATLTACSEPAVDQPVPDPFPARPANVHVDNVSECALLTEEQQRTLRLQRITSGPQQVDGMPARTCTFLGESDVDINTQVIEADAAMARRLPAAAVTQVNGFGAVTNTADRSNGGPVCQVAIDAAPDRTVRIQALSRTSPPPIPIDQICQRATEAASMVMTTVVATASR